jgi:hypothetical protein
VIAAVIMLRAVVIVSIAACIGIIFRAGRLENQSGDEDHTPPGN